MEENVGALSVKLTEDEVKEVRDLIEATEVYGLRYPDVMMNTLFADTPAL